MIQAMILIQLQMRKKKGIRSLNIILILTTLDIGASISDRPSLAMYGRPYFLFQIYIYSYKQYFRSSIVRCTFHKALQYSLGASQNIWTFIVPFTLVFVILRLWMQERLFPQTVQFTARTGQSSIHSSHSPCCYCSLLQLRSSVGHLDTVDTIHVYISTGSRLGLAPA